jgi:hypothetical protein
MILSTHHQRIFYYPTFLNESFCALHLGQTQDSGSFSNGVFAGIPRSMSPLSSLYIYPQREQSHFVIFNTLCYLVLITLYKKNPLKILSGLIQYGVNLGKYLVHKN